MSQERAHIEQLLCEGKIVPVIRQLQTIVNSRKLKQELNKLHFRFSRSESDFHSGNITSNERNTENNRICDSLLTIISRLHSEVKVIETRNNSLSLYRSVNKNILWIGAPILIVVFLTFWLQSNYDSCEKLYNQGDYIKAYGCFVDNTSVFQKKRQKLIIIELESLFKFDNAYTMQQYDYIIDNYPKLGKTMQKDRKHLYENAKLIKEYMNRKRMIEKENDSLNLLISELPDLNTKLLQSF